MNHSFFNLDLRLDLLIPVTFVFSKKQKVQNTPVSDYLGLVPASEESKRPIYFHWKPNFEFKSFRWNALFYSLFYVTNPGYKIGCCTIGEHSADVEKIVILYDKVTNKPEWVYFGSHGKGQGIWKEYTKCRFANDGSLLVYVSPSSHGMYPEPKTYWRILGFANDECSDDGEHWKPQDSDYESSYHQAWSDTHFQVSTGINSPLHTPEPGEHSITNVERFLLCLPCILQKIRK